jgi:hypothetical protein
VLDRVTTEYQYNKFIAFLAESSQRMLQDGALQSEFGLEVGPKGIKGVSDD